MSQEVIYKNIDALKPVEKLLDEASETLQDPDRTYSDDQQINEALVAAGGLGAGGAIGFASLYFGGSVVGLSAAGISSGLAAAGTLIGGGMVSGIAVLAAPAVILGLGGYALMAKRNRKILLEKKEMLLQQIQRKQNAIIEELGNTSRENEERIKHLTNLNYLLTSALNDLRDDLAVQAA